MFKQGEQYVFGLNLDKKYGDGTSHELYMKSQMLSKYTMNDLKEKLEYYQSKIFWLYLHVCFTSSLCFENKKSH